MAATAVPSATAAISYDDLYRRWEKGNWRATEIDFSQDAIDWNEKLTDGAAALGAVALHALLPRRGLGHRQPLALHRRRAAGGAEVLPRHPAGRRGAPRGVLQALHARGRRARRRHDRRRAWRRPSPSSPGAIARSSAASTAWPTSCAPTARTAKLAAAVTLYHVVVEATLAQPGQHMIETYLERVRRPPRLPRRDAQRRARRAAPHRLRRQAAGRPLRREPRADPGRDRRPASARCCRGRSAWPMPPNWDRSYTECFGFTLEDLGEEGALSLEQKLRRDRPAASTTCRASRCRWTSRRASARVRGRSCCAPA